MSAGAIAGTPSFSFPTRVGQCPSSLNCDRRSFKGQGANTQTNRRAIADEDAVKTIEIRQRLLRMGEREEFTSSINQCRPELGQDESQ
ncbi:hypothetical protein MRX96_007088 [Rhipicephalus microplus]